MNIKSILFDLDGVLLDTEGIYTDFWSEIDRRFPTGVDGFAHIIKGSTLPSILGTYFPAADHPAILEALESMEHNMRYRFFDGVETLLHDLKERGLTVAIVTSSNALKMREVYRQLPALGSMVDVLITDEDVTESKPSPQGYLEGARRLGRSPHECAVVEDSVAGLQAGRASGAYVIAIATTNPRERIEPMADVTLDATARLLQVLH